MSEPGATPIVVDTGAHAHADEDDEHHETATRLFENIRSGDVATARYSPQTQFSRNLRHLLSTNSATETRPIS